MLKLDKCGFLNVVPILIRFVLFVACFRKCEEMFWKHRHSLANGPEIEKSVCFTCFLVVASEQTLRRVLLFCFNLFGHFEFLALLVRKYVSKIQYFSMYFGVFWMINKNRIWFQQSHQIKIMKSIYIFRYSFFMIPERVSM